MDILIFERVRYLVDLLELKSERDYETSTVFVRCKYYQVFFLN